MEKILKGPFLAILFLLLAGVAVRSSAQSISGSIEDAARGKKARGTVVLSIPGGLHVNSNQPSSEYAIPTTVRLTASGAKISGVNYPRGRNHKFQFSENQINVYEGRAVFPFTVTVPEGFRGNKVRVRAVVRYQACTDEICYPPKSTEVTLTGNVK